MKHKIALNNGLVYIDNKWLKKNIAIDGEFISDISDEVFDAFEIIDCKGLKIIPGLIDPHVHFSLNCGKLYSVDDFYYGSIAASFGGVTTIVDFLDPSRNAQELKETYIHRQNEAKDSLVDYHFHACLKMPNGSLEEYVFQAKKLGINTIKIFTTYSDTGRRTYDEDIIELLKLSEKYNMLILAHIEADDMIKIQPEYTYKDLCVSRPSYAETIEALKLASFVRKYGGYLYMVHCSSGETLRQLKEEYQPEIDNGHLIIETCPQYLVFNNNCLDKDNGQLFTFAPPLRSERERQLLVANFDDIKTIGTDHCSFMKEDKNHPTLAGFPLGVGGIEFSFSLLYHRFGDRLINKMSKNVALIEGFKNKGELKIGYYADIAIFKEEKDYFIHELHGKCDYSIYDGVLASGEFIHTIRRGEFILKNREIIPSSGKELILGD